jgi:hypothetical protein
MASYTLDDNSLGPQLDNPNVQMDHSTMTLLSLNAGIDMGSLTNAGALGNNNATIGDIWWFDGTTWHLALG